MHSLTNYPLINEILRQLDRCDYPLLNSGNVVNADNNSIRFELDNAGQSLKLSELLNEFGLKAKNIQDNLVLQIDKSIPDFSVLNTRRAYFFDELIFGR